MTVFQFQRGMATGMATGELQSHVYREKENSNSVITSFWLGGSSIRHAILNRHATLSLLQNAGFSHLIFFHARSRRWHQECNLAQKRNRTRNCYVL